MTVHPLTPRLTNALTKFAAEFPGGSNNPEYQLILNSITSSSSLIQILDGSLADGNVAGFSLVGNTTGIYFNTAQSPASLANYIIFSSSFVNSVFNHVGLTSTSSLSYQSMEFDVVGTLAHEDWHALTAPNLKALDDAAWNNLVSSYSSSVDKTGLLTDNLSQYVVRHVTDEGEANIQGWNAAIDKAIDDNNGQPLTAAQIQAVAAQYPMISSVSGIPQNRGHVLITSSHGPSLADVGCPSLTR